MSISQPSFKKEPYELGKKFTVDMTIKDASKYESISIIKKPIDVKTSSWDNGTYTVL